MLSPAKKPIALRVFDRSPATAVAEASRRDAGLLNAWYNFCRKYQSLGGSTPAMAARLAERAWSLRELLECAV